jgi:hypothetical protein
VNVQRAYVYPNTAHWTLMKRNATVTDGT